MGFYFDEFEKDKKQHINLSESAWLIIEQDIKNFYLDEKEESKSGFLNRIFLNFHQMADASISSRYIQKTGELEKMFDGKEFKNIDNKIKDTFMTKVLIDYEKSLKEKASSYIKGTGEKFRINIENVEILKNSQEDEYYDGSIGLYLKAIFEEYCLKSNYEREQIFFKDIIDRINVAISLEKKIKISIKQKLNVKLNEYKSRKFYVTPYKIIQDKTNNYNYVIGYSEEILNDNTLSEKQIASFRISRIDRIMVMSSMSGFISKDNKNKIEKEIDRKGVQFMAGELIDIKVRFSKKGIENFNRQLYMKPLYYKKVNDEELTYIVSCTEVQAINYFLKFARDVEIISPINLREKFIQRYEDALNVYKKR